MSELISLETVDAAESLGIPGIDAESMRKIGSSQRIANQQRTALAREFGFPVGLNRWALRDTLRQWRPQIAEQLKEKKPNLPDNWKTFLWLSNNEIGLLLVDGMPLPLHSEFSGRSLPVHPEWSRFEPIELTIHLPDNPSNASVLWRVGKRGLKRAESIRLPTLEVEQIPLRFKGDLPLRNDRIHVFDNHTFTLVKTYEPWRKDLSSKSLD